MDRGTWWAIVHRAKKSRIQLIDYHFHFLHTLNKHNYWLKYTESVFLALRRGKKQKEKPLTIDNCPLRSIETGELMSTRIIKKKKKKPNHQQNYKIVISTSTSNTLQDTDYNPWLTLITQL